MLRCQRLLYYMRWELSTEFCLIMQKKFDSARLMIRVKLREVMESYRLHTGERISYARLAEMSGVAEGTLNSIGSRLGYQPNLATIERICRALDVPLHELLELIDDPPKPKPKRTPKKRR